MTFKLAMTLKELKDRTSKRKYKAIKFLSRDSREVKKLSKEDLMVLCHLTRAAKKIDEVHFKLEDYRNEEFLKFLDAEIEKGDKKAPLAKRMFLSQKSMFSPDSLGNQTVLAKGVVKLAGQNYFPSDLSVEEFHQILNNMIDDGKIQEVKDILNQRSIVVRDGKQLKAIDFVDAFPEFQECAKELREAIKFSTDKKFNEFLELQAKALETADPMLDAKADKAWAKLDRSKFEFTLTRECYDEVLTKTIFENKALKEKLDSFGIEVYTKDNIGARVGIVNKSGTKLLKKLKELIDVSAKFMPFKEEYENKGDDTKIEQTAVDVDLVTLTGEEGSYQASIVTAQNLPNDDKPALKIGGGRRNVYHRQVRASVNKKLYKNIIAEDQFKYFNSEADHWAVICHENTHTLGPKSGAKLGKFSAILEEYKADMGMYAFLDEFANEGYFSGEQIKEIMVTSLSRSFLKGKPSLSQAHRTRSVMICNRMLETKSIVLGEDGKLHFDFDKIKATTKKMMSEVVRLQIDADVKKAEEYVSRWFVWTDEIAAVAEVIKAHSKMLNGHIVTPLADEMLASDFEEKLNA
ncbi:MAG: hypothetical protein IKB06_04690 [Clostridia bacterium]|nr:hypothetical protein [Clostridia bacterium]